MRRVLLTVVLFGCGDEVKEAPAPVVAKAPAEAPGGLGAELAAKVEDAKVRCKAGEGIERTADLDAVLTGEWEGEYRYTDQARDPVAMDVTLVAKSGELAGSTSESNTFARGGPPELVATVGGEAIAGGRIVFMKTYGPPADHSILYIGQLSEDRRTIEGRWHAKSLQGTFSVKRTGLRG